MSPVRRTWVWLVAGGLLAGAAVGSAVTVGAGESEPAVFGPGELGSSPAAPAARSAVVPGASPAGLPRIGLSDSLLYYEAYLGGDSPPGQDFTITNVTEISVLEWRVEADRFFVGVGPQAGVSNEATVQVWIVATTDLLLGMHTANVIVTSDNAVNSPETVHVEVMIVCPIQLTGDANFDGVITPGDIIYLANYVLKAGPLPLPVVEAGDVNCDRAIGLSDIIYLVNYVLKGGPAPCDACVTI